jgi:hypothetical protein
MYNCEKCGKQTRRRWDDSTQTLCAKCEKDDFSPDELKELYISGQIEWSDLNENGQEICKGIK